MAEQPTVEVYCVVCSEYFIQQKFSSVLYKLYSSTTFLEGGSGCNYRNYSSGKTARGLHTPVARGAPDGADRFRNIVVLPVEQLVPARHTTLDHATLRQAAPRKDCAADVKIGRR